MSLAMYAAPFENDNKSEGDNNSDSIANKKRQQQSHNKTQKKYPKESFDQEKVNSVLEKVHNNSKVDDENEDNLGNYVFNPPPKPQSAGVQKTVATEEMQNMASMNMLKTLGKAPHPGSIEDDNLDLNNFKSNYGDADDYYSKFIPGYKKGDVERNTSRPFQNQNFGSSTMDNSNDLLLKKINYMINLLEEQQDEKTTNVTEEVVLYSFLGIFIIFVVDSFARIGKYVR
jgi:hypothetical protein